MFDKISGNGISCTSFELSELQSQIATQFLIFAAQVSPRTHEIAIHFKTSSSKLLF